MTLILPLSLRKGLQISAALTAAALIGLTPSGAFAKMPNIKRQSNLTVSFDLQDPVDPASLASGVAKIELEEERKSSTAELEVEVEGLQPGTYSVDATLADATTINLGDIVVTAVAVTPPPTGTVDDSGEVVEVEVESEGTLAVTLGSSLDVLAIESISVSTIPADATAPVVVLTGDAVVEATNLNFFANVRVTAPPASALTNTPSPTDDAETEVESGKGKGKGKVKAPKAPKAKKIHGHALAQAKIADGVTKKIFFQFIGFGAPGSTTLNVVVNGETAGTVTSSKQGKVKFREGDLDTEIDFATLDLVTITTEDGTPVMQADF